MYKLHSFPWHVNPNLAISQANLPNPAPGTKTRNSFRVLLKQISNFEMFEHKIEHDKLLLIRLIEQIQNFIDYRLVTQLPFQSTF